MARDSGIGNHYEISYPVALTLIVFIGIALYNVIELTLVIFTTFKRRDGLYFYSLLVATWGIAPYAIGFFLKFYNITTSKTLYLTLIAVGWPCKFLTLCVAEQENFAESTGMITGQSLVLYSRLHLVYRNSVDKGKWVLMMIIVNATICHIPIIVLLYGANSSKPEPFLTPYSIYEKVQITIFFIQEVCISGLYLFKTSKLLRAEESIRGRNARTVMTHLIWVNVMIIIVDITLLAIEYAGYYDIQTVYKAAVYSVKLKMEFSILNRLLDLFQGRIHDSSSDPRSRSHTTTAHGGIGKKATLRSHGTINENNPRLGGLGHSAYARMKDPATPVHGIGAKDVEGVVKTTEVRIERTDRYAEADIGDIELESLEGDSSKTENNRTGRSGSMTSSELRIMRDGY